MAETVPERPAAAPQPGHPAAGRKFLGMSTTAWIIVLGVGLLAGAYLLYRRNKASQAAQAGTAAAGATETATGTCPDGSVIDCGGTCSDGSSPTGCDQSGQISTLQTEIENLQSGEAGETAGTTTPVNPGGPAVGPAGPPGPPGPAAPPPAQCTQYAAPGGLAVTGKTSSSVSLTWSGITTKTGCPSPSSYTAAAYGNNGQRYAYTTVTAPDAAGGKVTVTLTGLHPGWSYHLNVWANGGKIAPPHATASVTLPAAAAGAKASAAHTSR